MTVSRQGLSRPQGLFPEATFDVPYEESTGRQKASVTDPWAGTSITERPSRPKTEEAMKMLAEWLQEAVVSPLRPSDSPYMRARFLMSTTNRTVFVILPRGTWPETEQLPETAAEWLERAAVFPLTPSDYVYPQGGYPTGISTSDILRILLEEKAQANDPRAFAALAEAIDWSVHPPDELLRAIDLALSLELAALAIELAQQGAHLYPEHERLQRAAQVLAPPSVRAVKRMPATELGASTAWLREHSSDHRGQWVAVRKGKLLGAAPSLRELRSIIGQTDDRTSIVITKML